MELAGTRTDWGNRAGFVVVKAGSRIPEEINSSALFVLELAGTRTDWGNRAGFVVGGASYLLRKPKPLHLKRKPVDLGRRPGLHPFGL